MADISKIREPVAKERKFKDVILEYDVILVNSEIYYGIGRDFYEHLEQKIDSRRKYALVLITTRGGSPDDAFKMMRYLQGAYEKVEVILMGGCYSAGTLFALGANTIHMAPTSNLGPLDVQIQKEDDWTRMSGECYRQALAEMNDMARYVFDFQFSALKSRRDILISTSTASKIASEITVGLLSPITSQIEPGKLGEVMRSQRIGDSYAKRLMKNRYPESVINSAAKKLAMWYPSHSTVIDFEEAKELGLNVKRFDLQKDFGGVFSAIEPMMYEQGNKSIIEVLNDKPINIAKK